jgi:LPS export ABC transporter protein LptC
MKSVTEKLCVAALLGIALVGAVGAALGQDDEMPIEDLRLPVDFFEDGRIRTQLRAERALVPPHGDIKATGVRIEQLSEDGAVESVVVASECRYDRTREVVTSESRVQFNGRGITISGKGLEWRKEDEKIRILSNVRVFFLHSIDASRRRHGQD